LHLKYCALSISSTSLTQSMRGRRGRMVV
jgi:hypothetical protein